MFHPTLQHRLILKILFFTSFSITFMFPKSITAQVNSKGMFLGEYFPQELYTVNAVAVSGTRAYLVGCVDVDQGIGGIEIVDVSNPGSPVFLGGNYNVPGWNFSIYISGDKAYVAGITSAALYDLHISLHIINVSDPANPTLLGSCGEPTGGYNGESSVYVSGSIAYVSGGRGLLMIDVSDPANPALIGSYDASQYGAPTDVHVSGSKAYLTTEYSLLVINVSNPQMPELLGNHYIGSASGVYISGNTAYVSKIGPDGTQGLGGLRMVDVSDPTNPTSLGSYECIQGEPTDVQVSGNTAFVTARYFFGGNNLLSLNMIDISDPVNPKSVGSYSTFMWDLNNVLGVYVSNGTAYVATGGSLMILNVGVGNGETNTPVGTNVAVQPIDQTTGEAPVTATFSEINTAGVTSLTMSGSGPEPPAGFVLGVPPNYYNIGTTASYSPPITISIMYNPALYNNPSILRILHYENNTWVDVTISNDAVNHVIYGQVNSLSLFIVAQPSVNPPVIAEITAPIDPVRVNTEIIASAAFTDQNGTHTAQWSWGDGGTSAGTVSENNGSGTVTGSHTYQVAGVYTVKLTVTGQSQNSAEAFFQYIVVFDPDAGFVTGGGWINSPQGAYEADPNLTGKANFGFVSKYKKGSSEPTGDTQFQFKAASLNFKSTDYEWLVIAGGKAKYKGTGTINGAGDYGFMLTATDGQWKDGTDPDKFRIKIWSKDAGAGVVYDNQMGASDDADATMDIGGGSIVVHSEALARSTQPDGSEEAELLAETPTSFTLFQNYPNPFNPETKIRFALPEDRRVVIQIFTIFGQEIRTLANCEYKAGYHSVVWNGKNRSGNPVSSGIYLYRIIAGEFTSVKKMSLLR